MRGSAAKDLLWTHPWAVTSCSVEAIIVREVMSVGVVANISDVVRIDKERSLCKKPKRGEGKGERCN